MATERRLAVLATLVPVGVLLATPVAAAAAPPWWQPLAFAGREVSSVTAAPGQLTVVVSGATYVSTDGGRSFQAAQPGAGVAAGDEPVVAWRIHDGTVVTGPPGRPAAPDPGSPFLGTSAHLIAAPAATPGVVVAVGADNHVWRRDASGRWATSFILLPAGGLAGAPTVTSLAAFSRPLSAAVYMGTSGYGVLVSEDGGDDWIRADPGLPGNVLALATDSSARALYAATADGLYVHQLQALPSPPAYHDADLVLRWLGIAVIAALATAAALVALRRALPSS